MADSTFAAFDGGAREGTFPESPCCTNGKEGEGTYPTGAVTVLGSTLWNKTIPYDPDLKVALEFMDLEEFLNENNIPSDDLNQSPNFAKENGGIDDSNNCGRVSTSAADLSCSFASLTTPVGSSSASNSPVRPSLQTPPSCSPVSFHDSNSCTYFPPQSNLSFINSKSQLLFEDSNEAPDCHSTFGERRSRSPENLTSQSSPLLPSVNVNDKTIMRSINSTSNSASEKSYTSSTQPFIDKSGFASYGEYSDDFHGVISDQSLGGGENPSTFNINQTSRDSNSEPRHKVGDSRVAETTSGSWGNLRSSVQRCDTTCSASTVEVTQERGKRKSQGRAARTPSAGVRNRRRRSNTNYAEIDDDLISELCDFTKDQPEQVDDRVASSQQNPGSKTGEKFNPLTRKFSVDELKPQPMVKKSKKQYVLPDLKDDKYWARRQKNNVAAKRSRDARRVKENQIAIRASYLEEMHSKLKKQLDEANETISSLQKRLSKYEPV
ncbi:Basic-leucine zipper domain [Trinorchestia longiramus]|nr:Basic-leucine zipper domain [Trinorchestia longiramus]